MTTTPSQKIKTIEKELGVPDSVINKISTNAPCKTSDENNLGLTYRTLDTYLLERNK